MRGFPSGISICPPRRTRASSRAARSGFEGRLDLRELRFVDSTGIRVILTEHQFATALDRELSLTGGRPAVRRALEVCGLLEHLRVEPG